MLCGNLDGKEIWRRMDTCIFMAGSLYCSPETVTTLFVNLLYLNIKCVFFFLRGQVLCEETGGKDDDAWLTLVFLLSILYHLEQFCLP